jgi:ppGpp synthetase/RelA/SpoT-type nucleotidyltranferase
MHLTDDARLKPLIHSGKYRTKDPTHLLDKLKRKDSERLALPPEERPPLLSIANLLERIDDLAGVRLLHLHTTQMEQIHPTILQILAQNRYTILEEPIVYFWDLENQGFFAALGINPVAQKRMYTSVHYVVSAANRPEMRIELQVRTLMEEVWGEVSHSINYPHETEVVSCREQLLALARFTSGCTRLVDSIFATHHAANDDAEEQ